MSSPEQLDAPPPLEALFKEGAIALFLDFDGTLVEIAPQPDAITVPAGLAASLEGLAARASSRLAVVSGRSLEDLAKHFGEGLAVAQAGSHGAARRLADGSRLGEQPEGLAPDVISTLEAFAASEELRYEAKTHGGALHYRENPDAGERARSFAEQLAKRHDLALKTGKCVVELVRKGADKASAVHAFMKLDAFADAKPVFLGDDVTDEDGFAACTELGGFGVLVGDLRPTKARFRLATVGETHKWLGL